MANTKISDLPAAGALAGTELTVLVQTGANVQTDLDAIVALAPQGTVTSVGGTGTVQGLTLSGTVTGSGDLTLGGSLSDVDLANQVTGTLPVANGGTGITNDVTIVTIPFIIDGGGVTITTGLKGYLQVDFACTIQSATLLGDQTGSIVVDIFKSTYAAFDPPTTPASGNKITASAPPTITTAKKSTDSTLTGWTTTISAGDVLAFNVNSVTTMTRVTLALKVKRT